ncbi:MAG: hypothetical protein KBC27_01520 [Rickettsiales bacterium]|nr:hypothetical protein [Rickettsiales bacterium]
MTPSLDLAAMCGTNNIIRILLDHNVEINFVNDGLISLHHAALCNHTETHNLLVLHGALPSHQGVTPKNTLSIYGPSYIRLCQEQCDALLFKDLPMFILNTPCYAAVEKIFSDITNC